MTFVFRIYFLFAAHKEKVRINRQLPKRVRNPKPSVPAVVASRDKTRAAVIHDGLKVRLYRRYRYEI